MAHRCRIRFCLLASLLMLLCYRGVSPAFGAAAPAGYAAAGRESGEGSAGEHEEGDAANDSTAGTDQGVECVPPSVAKPVGGVSEGELHGYRCTAREHAGAVRMPLPGHSASADTSADCAVAAGGLRNAGTITAREQEPCDSCRAIVHSRRRGSLVAVPNPTIVTARRIPAGDFSAAHEPNGSSWVAADNAGALVRATLSDVAPGTRVQCTVSIHDMVGNLVTTRTAADVVLPGNRVLDIYWNCTNDRGYPVQAGVYRALVLVGVDTGVRETVWYKGFTSIGVQTR